MYEYYVYLDKDIILSEIYVNHQTRELVVKDKTTQWPLKPFKLNNNPNYEDFLKFVESRCFPRGRPDRQILLQNIGLSEYDPIKIVKTIGGFQQHDKLNLQYRGDVDEVP